MKISVKVPATTANIGPGFDCLGMALPIYNTITIEETVLPGTGIEINVLNDDATADELMLEHIPMDENSIIYKAVEDMEAAMKGMLDPEFEEKVLGSAIIKQIFKFSKVGNIAGCSVSDGIIKRDSSARIIRDGVVIYDGKIGSLQHEKDSVKEVKKGYECGITIEGFNDIKVGDVIESYEMVEVKR